MDKNKGKATLTPSKPPAHLMPSSPVVLEQSDEDRASHEGHLKVLKRECKLFHPNQQVYLLAVQISHNLL